MARLVSLGIIATLIVCLGITFYHVIAPFLLPLFLAAMVALLSRPLLDWFLAKFRQRRSLAAAVTTVSLLAAVMIPLLVGILLGGLELWRLALAGNAGVGRAAAAQRQAGPGTLDVRISELRSAVVQWIDDRLPDHVTALDQQLLSLTDDETVELSESPDALKARRREWAMAQFDRSRGQIVSGLQSLALKTLGSMDSVVGSTVNRTLNLLGAIGTALIALVVFALALYYFLSDGPELIEAALALIPVARDQQLTLMRQFESSVRAVVMATFLAAFGQGLATAIALKLVGFDHFLLLLLVSTFAALIPLAGTWLVWMPCAAWLVWTGHWGAALFLAVFGVLVVGLLDNVIRTWVLQSDTRLHPLLAFVSVLGGLQVMGLWGVFIGPIVACCLHSLIEIFNSELRRGTSAETPLDVPVLEPGDAAAEPGRADPSTPGNDSTAGAISATIAAAISTATAQAPTGSATPPGSGPPSESAGTPEAPDGPGPATPGHAPAAG